MGKGWPSPDLHSAPKVYADVKVKRKCVIIPVGTQNNANQSQSMTKANILEGSCGIDDMGPDVQSMQVIPSMLFTTERVISVALSMIRALQSFAAIGLTWNQPR